MRNLWIVEGILVSTLLAAPLCAILDSAAIAETAAIDSVVGDPVQMLLEDKRPAGELSKKELAKRMRAVRALIRAGGLSKDVAQRLEIMLETDRGVKKARKQATAGSRLSERTHSDFADRKSAKRGLCTLAASPGRVAPGSPVTLEWTVPAGFTSGNIRQGNTVIAPSPEHPTGSMKVQAPVAPSMYQYLMTITSDARSDTCTTTLKVTAPSTDKDVIFNLVPSTLAPSEALKHITFISTQTDESKGGKRTQRACELTYQKKGNTVVANWRILRESDVTKNMLKEHAWRIVNHHGNTQLCFPGSPDAVVASGSDFVSVTAQSTAGGIAHALTFGANAISMRARETELAIQFFGVPYFYKKTRSREDSIARKEIKLGQYLDTPFERRTITDYSSLVLTFDATPRVLEYILPRTDASDSAFVDPARSNNTTICVKGTPTRNAELGRPCIDKGSGGGSKLRISNLDLQWRDPRCKSRKDASNAICEYFGRSLGFTIAVADGRYEFIDDDPKFKELLMDPESGRWLYRYSLKHFFPPETTRNPFKIINKRTVIAGDLLQPMRNALLYAEHSNPAQCASDPEQCYVPPRLKKADGNLETDAEYLSHYSIGNGQIGYEATSLSDMTFDVNQLSLIGTRLESGSAQPSTGKSK
jgi:hypothetical protein